jgi:hypothetical protein
MSACLRVVYLAGSGHTGSTLLAMYLDAHPEISSVGEIAVKPPIRRRGESRDQRCSCGHRIVECAFWRKVFEGVAAQGVPFGPERWTTDYRYETPLLHRLLSRDSAHPWMRGVQDSAARWLPFHSGRVRRTDRANVAFVRAVLDTTGAAVFVDASKQPMRLAHLLRIPELDLRVVRLVRDVCAYAASAKRRGLRISDAARTWENDQRTISSIVDGVPAGRQLLLRYEDLCREPARQLRRLYAFCGVEPVEPPESVTSADHHVLGNSIRLNGSIRIRLDEAWRASLNEGEVREILSIAGERNQGLGYTTAVAH